MNSAKFQSLLAGKKLLIFDFDGTIADTAPLHAEAFSKVLAPMGIVVDYPNIAGLATREAMRQLLGGAGVTATEELVRELTQHKQALVREMLPHKLKALPGVDALLRWARRHVPIALATSGSRATVARSLEILGYTGWFNPLVCAEDVQRTKPDPECFLKIVASTGARKSDVLIFEDSPHGFLAASRAGIEYVDAGKLLVDAIDQTLGLAT